MSEKLKKVLSATADEVTMDTITLEYFGQILWKVFIEMKTVEETAQLSDRTMMFFLECLVLTIDKFRGKGVNELFTHNSTKPVILKDFLHDLLRRLKYKYPKTFTENVADSIVCLVLRNKPPNDDDTKFLEYCFSGILAIFVLKFYRECNKTVICSKVRLTHF